MTYLEALTRMLAAANHMHGFSSWVLPEGAGFNAAVNWWNGRERPRPHEGMDLFCWRDMDGGMKDFGAGSLAVCPLAGTVVSVCPDFLGASVFIASPDFGLIQIFGHLRPAEGIRPGAKTGENTVVGTVAPATGNGARPHLHVSLATGTANADDGIDWDNLQGLTLVDPGGWDLAGMAAR